MVNLATAFSGMGVRRDGALKENKTWQHQNFRQTIPDLPQSVLGVMEGQGMVGMYIIWPRETNN